MYTAFVPDFGDEYDLPVSQSMINPVFGDERSSGLRQPNPRYHLRLEPFPRQSSITTSPCLSPSGSISPFNWPTRSPWGSPTDSLESWPLSPRSDTPSQNSVGQLQRQSSIPDDVAVDYAWDVYINSKIDGRLPDDQKDRWSRPQGQSRKTPSKRRGPASFVETKTKWMERGYQLLKKKYPNATYSTKVFVGGLQYDTQPDSLKEIFKDFRVVSVQKVSREGHAYVIFEDGSCVEELLSKCERFATGDFFFVIGQRKAQIIPWALQEIEEGTPIPDQLYTHSIFVGGLHGETTAEHLKIIMEEKFGPVQHVLIDTDKLKYPRGSGRVQFVLRDNMRRALEAHFLEINTKHYSRCVQLEPFIHEGQRCTICISMGGQYFCRNIDCLKYFCDSCFAAHQTHGVEHKALTLSRKL